MPKTFNVIVRFETEAQKKKLVRLAKKAKQSANKFIISLIEKQKC